MNRILLSLISVMFCLGLGAQTEPYSNNWYVGNTKSGEWIKFKRVWLSEGYYRFTTQAVAGQSGETVHLELNDQTLKSNVSVPSNNDATFELVHLGHKQLSEGYYDIKLVFETGNVNCDMIFIRKSDNTADYFVDDDIKYELNWDDGMHTFAIGGFNTVSKDLLKGLEQGDNAAWTSTLDNLPFSRKQVQAYQKPSIYTFDVGYSRNAADIYIQEQVEAKVEVIFAHGRGEPLNQTKQPEDREFKTGPGEWPCSRLKYMVEAIRRNPYARDQIKVAYFVDNAPFMLATQSEFGSYEWGNPAHQEFVWEYAVKPWYKTVPRDLLYFTQDGKVPMQWWSANSHLSYPAATYKILEFFQYIEGKMKEEFDLDVAFVLSPTFFERDPRTRDLAWGVQGWFSWNSKKRIEIQSHKGRNFAFALNGGRLPMRETTFSTWDPETNLPEPGASTGKDYKDAHVSALLADGKTAMIEDVFKQGHLNNCEWIVLESWHDWAEGSTWYRSDHEEYVFPNQYMALVRQYADRNSGSILLEAEGCDEYYNTTPGNLGGTYRLDLYKPSELDKEYIDANLEVDLDIFRPLHSLSELSAPIFTNGFPFRDLPLKNITAGWRDVWGVRESDNAIYCHEADGYPIVTWRKASSSRPTKKIAFGSNMVWIIDASGNIHSANLPNNSACYTSSGWTNRTDASIPIIDIDASLSTVWGVDSNNKIYYRNLSGTRAWTYVPDGELTSITADEFFVWGFAPNGDLMRMSAQSRSDWRKVENPYNVIKISAGRGEVWGVTADNKIYRISSSGIGNWQYVNEGFKDVSVGVDNVWLLNTEGVAYKYEIYGYETASAFIDMNVGIENETQVSKLSVIARPNPFINDLTVEINSYVVENATLNIHDMNGKQLISRSIELYEGTNSVSVDGVENLPSGMYVLSVESKSQSIRTKIVKK